MLQTTQAVLNVFDRYRMPPTQIDQYESVGKQLLADKLDGFISQNKIIDFVMLGFPFKSTNTRDKVLGTLPDMAEEVTIKNFATFGQEIKQLYEPGINIHIASDGYIFNDILNVPDQTPTAYLDISRDWARTYSAPMSWHTLHNFYTGNDLTAKRIKIMQQWAPTWEALEQQILFNPDTNMLYRSMVKFMEEELADKPFVSNNQRHKAAKKLTREMMLRNEAYNALIRHEFKNTVRLSMHQSVNNGYKYSFKLIPGDNVHHSAWHSALLVNGNEYETIHRKDAIAAGYQLQYRNNQPYNFIK